MREPGGHTWENSNCDHDWGWGQGQDLGKPILQGTWGWEAGQGAAWGAVYRDPEGLKGVISGLRGGVGH